ncbi:hypothetical protein BC567DRAFT_41902 [Phyllosticta citribraziliensis]
MLELPQHNRKLNSFKPELQNPPQKIRFRVTAHACNASKVPCPESRSSCADALRASTVRERIFSDGQRGFPQAQEFFPPANKNSGRAPDLEERHPVAQAGDVTTMGDKTFFRDVNLVLKQARNVGYTHGDNVVAASLHECLRGATVRHP